MDLADIQTYLLQFIASIPSYINRFRKDYLPATQSFFDQIIGTKSQSSLLSIIILVLLFFISLKVLDFFWRMIWGWITFVFKIAMFFAFMAFGFWVTNRGVEGALSDIQDVTNFWTKEYKRYSSAGERLCKQKEPNLFGQQYGRKNKAWTRW